MRLWSWVVGEYASSVVISTCTALFSHAVVPISQILQEYAHALAPYCQSTPVDEVEELLKRLGRIGSGICAMLHSQIAIGKLFGKLLTLSCSVLMACMWNKLGVLLERSTLHPITGQSHT